MYNVIPRGLLSYRLLRVICEVFDLDIESRLRMNISNRFLNVAVVFVQFLKSQFVNKAHYTTYHLV